MIEMTESEWEAKYKPIRNPYQKETASWNGTMFETFGEELEFVNKNAALNNIWTWADGDEGDETYISNGYHLVNRIGYFITEVPYDHDETILITVD